MDLQPLSSPEPITTPTRSNKKLWLIIAGIIVVILLAILLVSPVSGWLKTSIYGSDIGDLYRPLVRHMASGKHCYDNGSQFCEKEPNQNFKKEVTLGMLMAPNNNSTVVGLTKPLYACSDANGGRYTATLVSKECSAAGYSTIKVLGYVLTQPTGDASNALYRCVGGTDTLLTDDTTECSNNYSSPQTLGYFAAEHVYIQHLKTLCQLAKDSCASGQGSQALCSQRDGLCANLTVISSPTPTSTPTVTPSPTPTPSGTPPPPPPPQPPPPPPPPYS